jgi:hypothetical protein
MCNAGSKWGNSKDERHTAVTGNVFGVLILRYGREVLYYLGGVFSKLKSTRQAPCCAAACRTFLRTYVLLSMLSEDYSHICSARY